LPEEQKKNSSMKAVVSVYRLSMSVNI